MDGSVVEKAKAEGEVVLYTAWGLDTVQALQAVFAKSTRSSNSTCSAQAAKGF